MPESRTQIDRRLREDRQLRWRHLAPLLWVRDHPGHTDGDFDLHCGPNATPEQAAEYKRWYDAVWLEASQPNRD